MKLFILLVISTGTFAQAIFNYNEGPVFLSDRKTCNVIEDVTKEYRTSFYEYLVQIYKLVSAKSENSFAFSPRTIWLILAAMAEGGDSKTKEQLFEFLNLPEDLCLRYKYYKLASQRIWPGDDLRISSNSVLVIEEEASINVTWYNFVNEHDLLDVVAAPLKRDPVVATREMRRILSSPLTGLDIKGNSVLLDAVDYDGLWNEAFSDAIVERSPFYDQEGEQIGSVDLMRMRKKVRINYIESIGAQILELPIGIDSRYRMIFAIKVEPGNLTETIQEIQSETVFEMINGLKESDEPVDVAIPRVSVTSETDVKEILENIDIKSLWTDAAATRSISEPAALPSTFIQRVTVTLNNGGLLPASKLEPFDIPEPYQNSTEYTNTTFIANRPFFFSLFDAETYTCIFSVGFTKPTYST